MLSMIPYSTMHGAVAEGNKHADDEDGDKDDDE